jgi:multicopper oxidase
LHGHDFAVIAQEGNGAEYDPAKLVIPKNPIRRDVVMLPADGYVVIAFKADNPGAWLLHCHIAAHASGGLSMQIMENQNLANKIWPKPDHEVIKDAEKLCQDWKTWCQKRVESGKPGCNSNEFQPDSGV